MGTNLQSNGGIFLILVTNRSVQIPIKFKSFENTLKTVIYGIRESIIFKKYNTWANTTYPKIFPRTRKTSTDVINSESKC
jgi:hypothetical protein